MHSKSSFTNLDQNKNDEKFVFKVPLVKFDPGLFETMKADEFAVNAIKSRYESNGDKYLEEKKRSLWRSIFSRIKNPTKYEKFVDTIKLFVLQKYSEKKKEQFMEEFVLKSSIKASKSKKDPNKGVDEMQKLMGNLGHEISIHDIQRIYIEQRRKAKNAKFEKLKKEVDDL